MYTSKCYSQKVEIKKIHTQLVLITYLLKFKFLLSNRNKHNCSYAFMKNNRFKKKHIFYPKEKKLYQFKKIYINTNEHYLSVITEKEIPHFFNTVSLSAESYFSVCTCANRRVNVCAYVNASANAYLKWSFILFNVFAATYLPFQTTEREILISESR